MDWNALGSWLGLAVSVAGFSIAIVQIRKTRSAAEAARAAVISTERRYASNTLLIVLPQLLQIDEDLGAALEAGRRTDVRALLTQWRHTAGHARGVASQSSRQELLSLATVFQRSISRAMTAERALADDSTDLHAATARVRAAIIAAAAAASEHLGSLQTYTGDAND